MGTATEDYTDLDIKFKKEESYVRNDTMKLRMEWEAQGEKSVCAMYQSWLPIPLSELKVKRIDYLSNFDVQEEDKSMDKVL